MVRLHDLLAYADDYLAVDRIRDYAPKGLQVEGAGEVAKIVTGVSACMPLFEAAVARKAQGVVVHHGMFWDNEPRVLTGSLKRRIKYLLDHDLSLIAYHLPLDLHPEVGNNAELMRVLGLSGQRPFGEYKGTHLGFIGSYDEPLEPDTFMRKVAGAINREYRAYRFGPPEIKTVAVCSGGAPELVREAVAKGVDCFVTGEETEWVYHLAHEEGIHYVAAGHHATERFGVRALGKHLAEKFGIDAEFVDVPNPI